MLLISGDWVAFFCGKLLHTPDQVLGRHDHEMAEAHLIARVLQCISPRPSQTQNKHRTRRSRRDLGTQTGRDFRRLLPQHPGV
jgi:hypothetical protein